MAFCRNCGHRAAQPSAVCPACGFREVEDRWAPPGARLVADEREPAPFGYAASGRPRRISLLSKLAMALATILPPVGLGFGIAATVAARRHKDRPGNRAVAISSIFTALHLGLVWGWVAFVVAMEARSDADDPLAGYGDPFDPFGPPPIDPGPVNAESTEELQRLLEQILPADPAGPPGE